MNKIVYTIYLWIYTQRREALQTHLHQDIGTMIHCLVSPHVQKAHQELGTQGVIALRLKKWKPLV